MKQTKREQLMEESRQAKKEARNKQALAKDKRRQAAVEKAKETVGDKTGFNPVDLLKAPIEPPSMQETEAPKTKQIGVMAIGLGVVVLGVLLALIINWALGVILAIMGGLVIAVGTLIKI